MNKLILLLSIVFSLRVQAQSGWQQITSFNDWYPDDGKVNDLYFVNDTVGFCATQFTIYRTTNGGNTWDSLFHLDDYNYIDDEFFSISFFDAENGVAGYRFGLLITHDGGDTWIQVDSTQVPTTLSVWGLSRINDSSMAGVGTIYGIGSEERIFFKTTDQGSTWNVLLTDTGYSENDFSHMNGCHFISPDTGFIYGRSWPYAFGTALLKKTVDGGISWEEPGNLNLIGGNEISDLFFLNNQVGWMTLGVDGYSYPDRILKTTDGGENWSEQIIDSFGSAYLRSVGFLNESHGWIGGTQSIFDPAFYETFDGGSSWQEQTFNDVVTGFLRLNNKVIFCYGGQVYKYTDTTSIGIWNPSEETGNITLFPNPASQLVTVILSNVLDAQLEFYLIDPLGRNYKLLPATLPQNGKYQLDLEEIPKGFYLLKVMDHGKPMSFSKLMHF